MPSTENLSEQFPTGRFVRCVWRGSNYRNRRGKVTSVETRRGEEVVCVQWPGETGPFSYRPANLVLLPPRLQESPVVSRDSTPLPNNFTLHQRTIRISAT